MGIYKVDNVSSEEWHRKQMRRHSIKAWAITILEISAMGGIVWFVVWLWEQFGV